MRYRDTTTGTRSVSPAARIGKEMKMSREAVAWAAVAVLFLLLLFGPK
jgi:hypothetical protein